MLIKKYKIYKYISPSNKIYIGQTCQTLRQRCGGIDGNGYKQSPHFYRAIQKYGFKNFQVEILKENLTLEEANKWEIYYINLFESTNNLKGYNILPGGTQCGVSEETKLKNSERMKLNNPMKDPEVSKKVADQLRGRKLSNEIRKNISEGHKKKIQCLETGEIFNSRQEAANFYQVSPSGIGRAATGEQQTSAGLHWRYIC